MYPEELLLPASVDAARSRTGDRTVWYGELAESRTRIRWLIAVLRRVAGRTASGTDQGEDLASAAASDRVGMGGDLAGFAGRARGTAGVPRRR
jgi:hypothetical protein